MTDDKAVVVCPRQPRPIAQGLETMGLHGGTRGNPSRRRFLKALTATTVVAPSVRALARALPVKPLLRVVGRRFVDRDDRTVILRGINLAGDSKVPPFNPLDDPADLDPLPALGFNLVRLLFLWEAFEPSPGRYDFVYLDRIRQVAEQAWARGLFVIIDFHQDAFARNLARGSGDGFPLWAVSPLAKASPPDNSPACKNWAIRMAVDRGMHRSWTEFFADTHGVRTRYLAMLKTVARAFAQVSGVIGYDLINEPWGDEPTELAPLYNDAGRVVRSEDPSAILFIEGHVSTNSGFKTRLPRPAFDNFVLAPHYYMPSTIATKVWHGGEMPIEKAFTQMTAKAKEWNVPLFLGEFGAPAEARGVDEYIHAIYDRLDSSLSSGAQWNYTPHWHPVSKDGWNGEDFTILDPAGRLRGNFHPRPYFRAIAGEPIRFGFLNGCPSAGQSLFEGSWVHDPARGETEIYLPGQVFPAGSSVRVIPDAPTARREDGKHVLFVSNPRREIMTLRVVSPRAGA